MRRFLAAIRFLTIIPVPGSLGTAEADIVGSKPFFPLVGLAAGAAVAALAWLGGLMLLPVVMAALTVILMAAVSGGLHLDGLSDTADGFLSSRPRERILEIMKDSHVGAMGVIAIVCVLMVKFAALAASGAPGHAAPWASAGLAVLGGRCMMVVSMTLLPYARPEGGLGSIFYRQRSVPAAAACAVVPAVAGFLLAGRAGLAAAVIAALVTMVFALQCRRKIGGATGDTIGATCELAEAAMLVVLSA